MSVYRRNGTISQDIFKRWFTTILLLVSFSLLFPARTIAAVDATPDDVKSDVDPTRVQIECVSPPAYTFKTYRGQFLNVELEIPDIWTPKEDKGKNMIKFIGPNELVCVDFGSLDYKNIRGFLPDVPYTLEEGKKFFSQQWMNPRELIANMKVLKTRGGYSAIYSADDFIGIAGIKFPDHTKPLVLLIFTERDGTHIEQRIVYMLNTLKQIKP